MRAVFGNLLPRDNFIYHLLDSQPPGTIDTSLIASDNINNPNTMNAVFKLPQRAVVSFLNPRESIVRHQRDAAVLVAAPRGEPARGRHRRDVRAVAQAVRDAAPLGPELRDSNNANRRTPRILLDGADSIGGWGALARVYLNIGTHWEHWNQLHLPVVGFRPQEPFRIDDGGEALRLLARDAAARAVPARLLPQGDAGDAAGRGEDARRAGVSRRGRRDGGAARRNRGADDHCGA